MRKLNRTVLEVELGILLCAVLLQVASLIWAKDRLVFGASLLLGSVLSAGAIVHMYRTLDRALGQDEGTAQKLIYRGYILRYSVLVFIILFLIAVKCLNPLLVFLAYMSLKVAVYLQPFTHKFCNKIFHESDPEPSEEVDDSPDGARERE